MKNIASILNLKFNYPKESFNINYSGVLNNILKNIFLKKGIINNTLIIYDVVLKINNTYITDIAMGGGR